MRERSPTTFAEIERASRAKSVLCEECMTASTPNSMARSVSLPPAMTWLLRVAAVVAGAAACVEGGGEGPLVGVAQGALRGAWRRSRAGRTFAAFQGVPYAEPPVGPRRFLPPVEVGAWEVPRDAIEPGSPCLQSNATSKGVVFGSEDCLYLNVYSHKVGGDAGPPAPVMVYFHGGGFADGFGHMYEPDFMMDRDIVLVTLNYRLGALGFLSAEDGDLPGNNGLKDQAAALRWVAANAGSFGGDPARTTIWGESAGAASVHYHMLSPATKGLFQRGIAHSGTAYSPWAAHAAGQARSIAERFAAALGCNHFSTRETLDCLRDMPGYVLVEVAHTLHEWTLDPVIIFPPVVEPADTENAFITSDPWKSSSEVPWISGITSTEAVLKAKLLNQANLVELNDDFEIIGPLTLLFRGTAEDPMRTALAVKKFYFLDGDIKYGDIDGLEKMYSDTWFVYPGLEAVRRHKGPKYLYYFSYRGVNSLVPEHHGVSHFDDMQYFFPMNQYYKNNFNESAADNDISTKLIDLWVNFAANGTPTTDSEDDSWTEATSHSEYLHIRKNRFVMDKELLKERDSFWSKLPYRDKYQSEKYVRDEL